MKSSAKVLGVISASRAERMLVEWVNARAEGVKVWQRVFRRYPEILSVEVDLERRIGMANKVGEHLRRAWDAPDLRQFEWHTWKAQMKVQMQEAQAAKMKKLNIPSEYLIGPDDKRAGPMAALFNFLFDSEEPPAYITPVEAAIFYLRHHRKEALHCLNAECPSPYFFRARKSQQYCSPECAKPAQREAKRKWWNEHRAKKEE